MSNKDSCKQYYQQHKKDWTARKQARRDAIRAWINALKSSLGCKDCGYNQNPLVLQFDHLRDKVEAVSVLVSNQAPKTSILKEIEKCEVVCANCHMIRTALRRKK